jgi:hypothetical protein
MHCRYTSVSTEINLQVAPPRSPGSISGRSKKFFLFSINSRPSLRSTLPPIQWTPEAVSPRVKRPGREADQSSPSSTEIQLYLHSPCVFKTLCLIKPVDNFTFLPVYEIFEGRTYRKRYGRKIPVCSGNPPVWLFRFASCVENGL